MVDIRGWKDCLIVVLALMLIGGFTFFHGDDQNIVSHLSLGSTLISIVLSLIAILYTLYQSTAAASQTERLAGSTYQLIESAGKVSSAVKGFDDIAVQVNAVKDASIQMAENVEEVKGMVDEIGELRGQVATLTDATSTLVNSADRFSQALVELGVLKAQIASSVEETLRNQIAPVRQDIGNLSKQLMQGQDQKTRRASKTVDMSDFLPYASGQGLMLLYSLSKAREQNSTLPFCDIVAKVGAFGIDYCFGFLVGFSCYNQLSPTSRKSTVEQLNLDENVSTAVAKDVQRRLARGDEYIKKMVATIDSIDFTVASSPPVSET